MDPFVTAARELGIPIVSIRAHRQRDPICASELFCRLEPHTLHHDVPKYTYNALRTASSFRLLELLSNEEDDMIKCNMFEADFESMRRHLHMSPSPIPGTPRISLAPFSSTERALRSVSTCGTSCRITVAPLASASSGSIRYASTKETSTNALNRCARCGEYMHGQAWTCSGLENPTRRLKMQWIF
jgi:hypothetical protein